MEAFTLVYHRKVQYLFKWNSKLVDFDSTECGSHFLNNEEYLEIHRKNPRTL